LQSEGFVCVCANGYSGASCNTAPDRCEYPRHVRCDSHGSCSDGHCTCDGGYSGSSCAIPPKKCCSGHYDHGCDDGRYDCGSGYCYGDRNHGCDDGRYDCDDGVSYCYGDGSYDDGCVAWCDAHHAGWDADCDRTC
jgi:hypothetical protein